jgi:hypothetical protein
MQPVQTAPFSLQRFLPIQRTPPRHSNALRPGGGRTNRCESEDELSHRLAEDGAELSGENLAAALKALEGNGDLEASILVARGWLWLTSSVSTWSPNW